MSAAEREMKNGSTAKRTWNGAGAPSDRDRREHVACNLCGADLPEILFEKQGYPIVRCTRCGLVYVNPRPAKEDLFSRYSDEYFEKEYIPSMESVLHELMGYHDPILSRIKEFKQNGRLYDVGCGPAFFLRRAIDFGWEVGGCDISAFAQRYARERFGIDIHCGEIAGLDLTEGHFDAVTYLDVVEHLRDPKSDLARGYRMVREGGVMVVSSPNVDGPSFRDLGSRWDAIGPEEHIYYFGPETITRMMMEVGFRDVDVDTDRDVFILYAWKKKGQAHGVRTLPEDGLPVVSVIVLNWNGKDHMRECLRSLEALDYPEDRLEIMVLDNGSTDGSVEYIRKTHPGVRLLQNESNLGFAGPNNRAAAEARGECLAFLNNDMRVREDWLKRLVEQLDPERDVSCVASRVLSWDGTSIDFVDAGINFEGKGFQEHFQSRELYRHQEVKEVVFPNGGAFLVTRQAFEAAGGFDEDYFAYYEDVDLGWRLRLQGQRSVVAPDAVAYHRHGASSASLPAEVKQFHLERNALYSVLKNYGAGSLRRVLAPVLMLQAKRAMNMSELTFHHLLKREDTFFNRPDFLRATKKIRLTAYPLAAMGEVFHRLDKVLERREEVQAGRRVPDHQVLSTFGSELRPAAPVPMQEEYNRTQSRLLQFMDAHTCFLPAGKRNRILIVTHETLGTDLAGPAIRAVEMGRALSREFDVVLTTPRRIFNTGELPFRVATYQVGDEQSLRTLCEMVDVILIQGFTLQRFPFLHAIDKPLVVDLFCPFSLENLEYRETTSSDEDLKYGQYANDLTVVNEQLGVADFFICATEKQRDFWLGMLHALNRITPANYRTDKSLYNLLSVVPFGLPVKPPVKKRTVIKGVVPGIGAGDKVLLWGGSLLNWQDPLTLIKAMGLISEQREDLKLFFMGIRHPNPEVPPMTIVKESQKLSESLGLTGRTVFFNDWVPYAERADYLLESDLGVCTHRGHLETRFSFRTRLLDCVWSGLPMVVTRGDTFADLVSSRGLGLTVPQGDPRSLADALLEALDNQSARSRWKDNLAAFAPELSWDRVVEPLAQFCRRPAFARDKSEQPAEVQTTLRRSFGSGMELNLRIAPERLARLKKGALGSLVRRGLALSGKLASRRRLPVAGEIRGRRKVTQEFVAERDNLKGINVNMATFARNNTQDVVFRLFAGPDNLEITTIIINASRILDNRFHPFHFDPILDSRGQLFRFTLESPESAPGDAVTTWIDYSSPVSEGEVLRINGRRHPGRLSFKAYYA
jgi:GT2 family glycosyltransferase/2-polyprenyl-3-methyl-5-hydroxy-6-metoxy-1,4-benzoquinol methylase/glycosyltransferase involved in cell wall biosynthesis